MAQIWQVYEAGYPPPAVMAYKMRGMDAAISGLYDAWISVGTPDYAGTGYHGALATPLRDIVVIDTWET
jgi:hypothetical protein